ncbi:DUF2946 domain-containing protein [Massilia sp. S19_KUP03_FR1]|uniref:DUF2946 domain-containing protein n=1 Tax=Massilia sp. S19_KUP03_FR1 TaxID=3025503 RepID=UPI002FCD9F51
MGLTNITRRFAAWIACIAMLFAALAPSISHAMSTLPGDPSTEICSTSGSKFVKVTASSDDVSYPGKHPLVHVEHCPLCATHAGTFPLPPSAGFIIPLIETQATHPLLFFQAPHPLAIWTAAQSRAPPFLA